MFMILRDVYLSKLQFYFAHFFHYSYSIIIHHVCQWSRRTCLSTTFTILFIISFDHSSRLCSQWSHVWLSVCSVSNIDWNRLITHLFFCDWRFRLWLIRMQRSLSRKLMRLQNNWWWIYMIIWFKHLILRRNDISLKSSFTWNSSLNLFFAWKIELKLSFTWNILLQWQKRHQ